MIRTVSAILSAEQAGGAEGLPRFAFPFDGASRAPLLMHESPMEKRTDDIESKARHRADAGRHAVDAKAERGRAPKGGKIPPNQKHGLRNDPGRAYEAASHARGRRG